MQSAPSSCPQELSVESQTVLVISGPLLPTTVTITGSFAGGIVLGLTLTYSFFLSFQVLTWVLLFFLNVWAFLGGCLGEAQQHIHGQIGAKLFSQIIRPFFVIHPNGHFSLVGIISGEVSRVFEKKCTHAFVIRMRTFFAASCFIPRWRLPSLPPFCREERGRFVNSKGVV